MAGEECLRGCADICIINLWSGDSSAAVYAVAALWLACKALLLLHRPGMLQPTGGSLSGLLAQCARDIRWYAEPNHKHPSQAPGFAAENGPTLPVQIHLLWPSDSPTKTSESPCATLLQFQPLVRFTPQTSTAQLRLGSTTVSNSLGCRAGSLMSRSAHCCHVANIAFLVPATNLPVPKTYLW